MRLRGSVRLRLTALFGALFLAAGAGLLVITYVLVSHATSIGTGQGPTGVFIQQGTALPPPTSAQQAGQQLLQQAISQRNREENALLLYSGVALGIMAVASVALGWFVAGRALSPLRRITSAARRISATNLQERLAIDGPDDDLRELADTIDGLFARLDASFDAQRQFVANASHELRTPLTRSRTLLEVALRDPSTTMDSLRSVCERVLVAGQEQERLIEALLTLARSQRGIAARSTVDLAAIAHGVLAARGAEIASRGLAMEVTLAPAPMSGDKQLAERVVANLIDNALRHNVVEGAVRVDAGSDEDKAFVRVENTGPVIAADQIPRLLAPFQRLDAARVAHPDGLGIGLSIAQAVAAAHGADLTLTPRLGGGLVAEFTCPRLPSQPTRPALTATAVESPASPANNPAPTSQ